MKNILTIARKELLDTLRDRRTLITMVAVPLLIIPLILFGVTTFQISRATKAKEKVLRIGWIPQEQGMGLKALLEAEEGMRLVSGLSVESVASLIRNDSLDLAVDLEPDFDRKISAVEQSKGTVQLYFQSTEEGAIKRRLSKIIDKYEESILADRLDQLQLKKNSIDPIGIEDKDIATQQEVVGKMAGGFLPYMFVIFCFMGCLYPAIDLFTGEKERGTLETILTVPVNRLQILFGKMTVVVLTGLTSALLGILGLFLSIRFIDAIPAEFIDIIGDMLQLKTVLLLLAMLIPLAIFFAGMLIPIATYAKSFKEAQSIMAPLNFLVILPAVIGLIPGVELNVPLALAPILNVALSTKEIMAGTIQYGLLALVFFSLIFFAVAGVILSVRGFSKEGNIVRA